MTSKYYLIKFDYRAQLDSVYISVLGVKGRSETLQVSENLVIDLDSEKIPSRFRIAEASTLFQEKVNLLKKLSQVKIILKADADSIDIEIQFEFLIDNVILDKKLEVTIPNDIKMPEMVGNYIAGKSF
jgi:uncharacterized protein YuzE